MKFLWMLMYKFCVVTSSFLVRENWCTKASMSYNCPAGVLSVLPMKMMASYVAYIIFNVTHVYPFINMISIIFTQMDGATAVYWEPGSSWGQMAD